MSSAAASTNSLILITNHFPYGPYEAFLSYEIDSLTKAFDSVIVLARDTKSKIRRDITERLVTCRINPESNLSESVIALFLGIRHAGKISRYIRGEIRSLKGQGKRLSFPILKVMIHDLFKALATSHHLGKIIKAHNLKGSVTLYSYWLTSSALATTFVSIKGVNIKRVSRAHGGDVYEYRNPLKYLSFRHALALHLDRIFTISENGRQHLANQLPAELKTKITTSRLGIFNSLTRPIKETSRHTIVSCSFLIPVKQVHRIVEALSFIADLKIDWIHIGDGPLLSDVAVLANQKLGTRQNITYTFKGELTNTEIMKFYSGRYIDLFINTSAAEGIPVTMMEAQSFGIPVLGPDVGGISEIVSTDCGALFSADAAPEKIAREIERILTLPDQDYQFLRQRALDNWMTRYNADQNFSTFARQLSQDDL